MGAGSDLACSASDWFLRNSTHHGLQHFFFFFFGLGAGVVVSCGVRYRARLRVPAHGFDRRRAWLLVGVRLLLFLRRVEPLLVRWVRSAVFWHWQCGLVVLHSHGDVPLGVVICCPSPAV